MYCRTTSKQCHKQKRILSIHKKSFQLSLSVMLTRDRKATNKKEKMETTTHTHNYNSYFYEIRIKKNLLLHQLYLKTQ